MGLLKRVVVSKEASKNIFDIYRTILHTALDIGKILGEEPVLVNTFYHERDYHDLEVGEKKDITPTRDKAKVIGYKSGLKVVKECSTPEEIIDVLNGLDSLDDVYLLNGSSYEVPLMSNYSHFRGVYGGGEFYGTKKKIKAYGEDLTDNIVPFVIGGQPWSTYIEGKLFKRKMYAGLQSLAVDPDLAKKIGELNGLGYEIEESYYR